MLLPKSQQSMTDRTQYLLELAKRNVKAYIANPKTKAVMVAGSVAEGLCDEYSDSDVMIYYDELPSEQELHRSASAKLRFRVARYFGRST